MDFSIFEWLLLLFFVFLMTHSLLNRICTCVEMCALSRAFGEYAKRSGVSLRFDDFAKSMRRIYRESSGEKESRKEPN